MNLFGDLPPNRPTLSWTHRRAKFWSHRPKLGGKRVSFKVRKPRLCWILWSLSKVNQRIPTDTELKWTQFHFEHKSKSLLFESFYITKNLSNFFVIHLTTTVQITTCMDIDNNRKKGILETIWIDKYQQFVPEHLKMESKGSNTNNLRNKRCFLYKIITVEPNIGRFGQLRSASAQNDWALCSCSPYRKV